MNQEEKEMAKELLMASLRMERNPMAIPITDPSKLGIDRKMLRKLGGHIELGPMYIVPKSKREILDRLADQIVTDFESRGAVEFQEDEDREEVIAHSVVSMTKTMYEDFLTAFQRYEQEFNALRDKLVEEYDDMVDQFRTLYFHVTGCNEEEWNAEIKMRIPSKEKFQDSFKIRLDRAPLVLTSDGLGEIYRSEFLGKTLQKAFSLARYLDDYKEKPFTTEAKAFIHKEIGLLDELNVNENAEVNQVINLLRDIDDLIVVGNNLGESSQVVVRQIKEKIKKVAKEQNLLKTIKL
jgi:hypothetical protein